MERLPPSEKRKILLQLPLSKENRWLNIVLPTPDIEKIQKIRQQIEGFKKQNPSPISTANTLSTLETKEKKPPLNSLKTPEKTPKQERKILRQQEKRKEKELYQSIEYGLQTGQINESEAEELKKIVPVFNKGPFWQDLFVCNVLDYFQGWGLNTLASWLIATGHHWAGMAIFLSPISIQGLLRTPYIISRIKQELSYLRSINTNEEILNAYQKFYRYLFVLNLIRFPPLPSVPQVSIFTGALLTVPRGRKLNSLYLYHEIYKNQRIPAKVKHLLYRPLQWLTQKLP